METGLVTRNDVARRAGTSTAVVSYVINNGPRPVSAETRERVLRAIQELGYRPNAVARSLRARRTWTLGLVVPDSGNPFFGEFARAAEDAAWARDFSILIGNAAEDGTRAAGYVRTFAERQVDGLILMRVPVSAADVAEVEGLPVVMVDHQAPEAFSTLAFDDEHGTELATAHLAGHGHRRIGLVRGPAGNYALDQREDGWRRALRAAGLEPGAVAEHPLTREGGYAAAIDLLSSEERPSALFVCTDHQAVGVLRAAADLGLSVPDDLAVVGFDGTREAAFTVPGLTTVSQPIAAMARRAIEIVIGGIEGQHRQVHEIFPASLTVRGTCGCAERGEAPTGDR